ncbi:avidin [Myxocyprinus asiaticus]|uniref:avidin n=1 Tax=Myxocyprinus asiaticus TaxID=70543 RepID=UPI00222159F9|nr:avidin [Myxocyprinus asiaticus]
MLSKETGITDAAITQVNSCNITGVWRNELGSTLRMKADGSEVRGVYQTSVESARGAAGPERKAKILGIVGGGPQPTISFAVMWEKGSCSAWVGQCFILPNGTQVLKTFWLLRSVAYDLAGDWGSTRLGEDVFFSWLEF